MNVATCSVHQCIDIQRRGKAVPIQRDTKSRVIVFSLKEVAALLVFVLSMAPIAYYTGMSRQELTEHGLELQRQANIHDRTVDQQSTINERLNRTDAELLKLTHAMDVRLSALYESHTSLKGEIEAVRSMLQEPRTDGNP